MSDDTTLDEFIGDKMTTLDEKFTGSKIKSSLDITSAGDTPNDWFLVRLRELTENTLYGANESAEDYDPEKPRYIRIKDIDEQGRLKNDEKASLSSDKAEGYHLKKGDMLFARSGSPGRTYLHRKSEDEYCYGGYSIKHELVSGGLNHEYLSQYTKSSKYWDWIERIARTGAQANINSKEYASLLVPLPPLSEQRKIATVLHTLDQAIQKTEEVIEQIQVIKNGVRQDCIPSGVREHNYTSIQIGPEEVDMPDSWEYKSVSDVCKKVTDGTHETPEILEEGYPFITSEDVANGKINYNSGKYVSEEEHKKIIQRSKPERGDILLTHIGSIGNVAQVDVDYEFSIKNVALFKPDTEVATPDYLEVYLNSSIVENSIYRMLQGGVQDFLSITDLNKIPVLLPSIEEQKEIVNVMNSLSQLEEKERTYKQYLTRLKQGLIQDLLSGTVRTSQSNIEVLDEIAQYG